MTVTIGVLALQGDVREHARMMEAVGARVVRVRRASELTGLDGIVLPGGESTTMYKLARAFEVFEPVRDALAAGLPALGTCAGMVMLADQIESGVVGQETFGGLDVVVRRNAFGRQVDSFESAVRFAPSWAEPFDFPATFIRAPWVEKVGDGVEVVATLGDRVVAVRQGHLLATSFHPELTGDTRLHELFLRLL